MRDNHAPHVTLHSRNPSSSIRDERDAEKDAGKRGPKYSRAENILRMHLLAEAARSGSQPCNGTRVLESYLLVERGILGPLQFQRDLLTPQASVPLRRAR